MSSNFEQLVKDVRENFDSGRTLDINFRKQQLKKLQSLYIENKNLICQALTEDLHKPKQESIIMEINLLIDDISYILRNLDKWCAVEDPGITVATVFDKTRIYHDPYGVVLVLGAWNYPIQLPLLPVSGAIAAGNCVIIKPSELAPATARLVETLIPRYIDQDCYKVVSGGIAETTSLLKQRFDYIFFTGSPRVGKIVRAAANEHLTPTTLELGGKSPVFIDDSVDDMDIAVKRLMWGKCINLGQTCIAPDYVLCSRHVQDEFISRVKVVLKEWYGDDPQRSPDLCRIINEKNFERVKEYLKDGNVALGGNIDAEDKWIEPTILTDVSLDSKVMQEEIFGPILPIVNVESVHEAIKIIKSRQKPLALYVFSSNENQINRFMHETSFGGGVINDTLFHAGVNSLPFGGIGESGMGAYHGKSSYDTFTHRKSVLQRNYNSFAEHLGKDRYPPYSQKKIDSLVSLLEDRSFPVTLRTLKNIAIFGLGALTLFVVQRIIKAFEDDH